MWRSLLALGQATCLLAVLPACKDADESADPGLGGLLKAQEEAPDPIDVDAAAGEPDELLRAAKLPHRLAADLLGPHRFTGTSSVVVLEGDETDSKLEDETRITLDADGNFHARLDNSEDYGREVYFVDGTLYLRPRYGKYHRRPPEKPTEPAGIRDDIYGTLGAYFELLAPGAEVSDGGAVTIAGRNTRKIEIGKAPEPAEPKDETLEQREWRESAVVREVSGFIALDQESGVPLRAEVKGAVGFQRDGRSFVMRLSVTHEVESIGSVEKVTPPPREETVATPVRRTELDEREQLLEGIAPPAKTAPTPETVERQWGGKGR